MISYYKYYKDLRKARKRIKELESEIERLKHVEELRQAYRSLLWMMARLTFDPDSIKPEFLQTYHRSFKTIIEKEKEERGRKLIPWISRAIEIVENRLKTKAPQR